MPTEHHICDWLLANTLPLWIERGYDWDFGGFHEKLDLSLLPVIGEGKRTMVQARQAYTFAVLGQSLSNGTEVSLGGFDFLLNFGRHPDGGWRHRVTRDGNPMDNTRDLYDQAFVLLAAAWIFRVFRRLDALLVANETIEYLENERAHDAGGFTEKTLEGGLLFDGPRRQNPHMHLFEAFLALYEAFQDDRHLERAARIFALLKSNFIVDGVLREYLTEDLKPIPGNAGRTAEPGHHMEWVWLLHRYSVLSGDITATTVATGLYNFVLSYGYDTEYGGLYDEIDCGGAPIKTTRRLWPQTEALKAHLVRDEYEGKVGSGVRLMAGIEYLFRYHLNEQAGGWSEHIWTNGMNFYGSYPASSLYHLSSAVLALDCVIKKSKCDSP